MPSESGPEHRLMEGIAHGMKPTKLDGKKPPPVAVAKDFVEADKKAGKKFSAPKGAARAKALKPPSQKLGPGMKGEEGLEGGV